MLDSKNDFLKPSAVNFIEIDKNNAEIIIEPLERGFGHKLGNAFRRILLSSVPGCAVTSVKISGVLHEFTYKGGIYEDIIDIMLNLSNIKFKMENQTEILPKGTIVKLDGFPLELLADVPIRGDLNDAAGAQQ